MLRSGERPLAVNVAIPDVVLTGSRYDIDLIVEEPLGQALVAGGLIDLSISSCRLRSVPTCRWLPKEGVACSKVSRHRSNPVRRPGL